MNKQFIKSITEIIQSENFELNTKKTRLQTSSQRQQVTGLVINKKLNVKREYLQKVRAMLNNWEKGGLRYAETIFRNHQPTRKKEFPFKKVLLGHISFIKQIKGEDNIVSKKLIEKYSFLNYLMDYRFVDNNAVRSKLISDNEKMERILIENNLSNDDKFITFCTAAFHQIENLLNYYYWKKFPNFSDLLLYLILNNPSFKQRYKKLEKAESNFAKISELNINVLVYIYEKEFFFDKKIYYRQQITKLREIRNDESHRCSVINVDREPINTEYKRLKEKEIDFAKRKKNFVLSKAEKKSVLLFETFEFLEQKNYKEVRKTLFDIANNIKEYFINNV